VLTARAARARDAEFDLRERQEDGARHPDRLPVHVLKVASADGKLVTR